MTTTSGASRKIRAALKSAFPGTKFTVALSAGCSLTWTDDGPSVVQVEDALLAAGCGEARTGWNGTRYIEIEGDTLHFDRFNAAERAAYQQGLEHRTQEHAAQRQREDEAIKQALQVKRAATEPLKNYTPAPIQDTIFEAFERLRQRAESEVTIHDTDRRPSWAPPLILGEELAEACLELEYLTLDDKLIGRLWATFATPKRSGRWLREHTSNLPLAGLSCRGFQLHAGGARGSTGNILFEAQRKESGEWRFGPREWSSEYSSPRRYDWERLIRERERLRHELEHYTLSEGRQLQVETRLAEIARQIEAIDALDATGANEHRKHRSLRQQALELARARVLDFIGAPDAQMQLAARLWGHCCICGKELSDPISLERGIGPDCLQHRVEFIKARAQEGCSRERIVLLVGMPADFVTEVLNEA
jgi:Family of unknown function (DUF6011)